MSKKTVNSKPLKRKGGVIKRKPITMLPDGAFIQTFLFGRYVIRVVMIGNTPWWVFRDVCDALGYADCCDVSNRMLTDSQRCTIQLDKARRSSRRILISLSGLRTVLAKSTMPVAAQFSRWLDEKILFSLEPPIEKATVEEPTKPVVTGVSEMTVSQAVDLIKQKYNLATQSNHKKKKRGIKVYCTFRIIF